MGELFKAAHPPSNLACLGRQAQLGQRKAGGEQGATVNKSPNSEGKMRCSENRFFSPPRALCA